MTLRFPVDVCPPGLIDDLAMGMRLSMSQGREIQPIDIFRILNAAKLKAVLVGAHAVNARTGRPRATVDVDLIGQRPKYVAKAIQRAYPDLTMEDHPVVLRFRDAKREAIDVIKPQSSPLFKLALDSAEQVEVQGEVFWLPNVYALLALKFASMSSPTRQVEDKYADGRDFILIAKGLDSIRERELEKYGEAVYVGGGKDLLRLITDARAGRRLDI
jgi:hypothetical protein